MNETIIKNSLDFLIAEYGFKYEKLGYDNCFNEGVGAFAYNYYNDNGCFTIGHMPVYGDVDYLKFDNIDQLDEFFEPIYYKKKLDDKQLGRCISERYSHILNIYNYEPQIWESHEKLLWFKNPFAWISSKKTLRVLAEVIRAQIEKDGQFFGIKV